MISGVPWGGGKEATNDRCFSGAFWGLLLVTHHSAIQGDLTVTFEAASINTCTSYQDVIDNSEYDFAANIAALLVLHPTVIQHCRFV